MPETMESTCFACGSELRGDACAQNCTPEERAEAYDEWRAEFGHLHVSRSSFDVACQSCGYAGSIERVGLHSCQIAEQGGRCEDYPCCGHTDGDGCQTLPEHTSEHWYRVMASMSPERYDELDQMGHWDR